MNVVQREKSKNQPKAKNELLRRDVLSGIRGTSIMPISTFTANNTVRVANQAPRYQFSNNESSRIHRSSMGPPKGPPRSTKRKMITNSSSSRLESSVTSRTRPRVLASDSAVDTSFDMYTPKSRPTALRYISSSSRGGHSGTRSVRSTSTAAIEASVVLAISEGRGQAKGEIGIAAIDLRHPHLILCQFSDTLLYTHTLTKINFFNPVEIIVPHTFCEGVHPNQLYQLIRDQYPLVNLTTVQRRHFNDAAGRQHIQTLCAPEYSAVYLQVLHKFYALTAAAAVLKYVEYIQCIVFARESLKIEYHSSENTMIIDVGTATQLELVQPLVSSAGYTCCLLGVLGPLYTVGGVRALRASILQPSCSKEFIENRLDAVQDLIDNDSGLMVDLQDVIKKLADIDKILLLCVESTNQDSVTAGEAQLNQTLLLKTTMDMVPKLIEALQSAECGRMRKIKMEFENPHYTEIADRIRNIIQEDAHLERGAMGSLQRCFAVKPNINGLLDVARRTYSELIEDIQKIVEHLSETYDLQIRLNQNAMKGFHIVLPIAPKNRRSFNTEDLPPIFIQYASPEYNFTVITGPNMGGKSIYIKQIAIMQVMAQLGCFLPATNAVLRLCDRLYSRIGFNDSVELNASTYVYEMKEMQHIMKGLTKTSLVIIDELCRGTNEDEGTSIAWAICEELIASDAFIFFTTHFNYLTRLQDLYFSVVNLYASVLEEDTEDGNKRLIYEHKIARGTSKVQHYGLKLSSKINLPENTVKLAMELAEVIAENEVPQELRTPQQNDEGILYKLNADIMLESRNYIDSEVNIKKLIHKFKTDNPSSIQRNSFNKTDISANYSSIGSMPNETNNGINTNFEEVVIDEANKSSSTETTSVIEPSPHAISTEKYNPMTIRSSTELLRSIMNTDKNFTNDINLTDSKEYDEGENQNTNSNSLVTEYYINASCENMEVDIEQEGTGNNVSKFSSEINIIENTINESFEACQINVIDSDCSSDIAEALTQVIEESSLKNLDRYKSFSNSSKTLDEEFISEVINEINEELNESAFLNSIILTPPMEFRDN